MVKKANEIKPVGIEHFKGGNGIVTKVSCIGEKDFTEYAEVISRLILPPGASIGYHQHVGNEEMITILSGEAKYVDDGKEYFLTAGDVTICNEGHEHSFENCMEKDDLILLAVVIKK